MNRYILDSNIFDMFVDGHLRLEDIDDQGQWFVCPVQTYELEKTPNTQCRLVLLAKFKEIEPVRLPSSTFMLDTGGAGLDEGELNNVSLVPKFEDAINQHPKSKKGKSKGGRKNFRQDALILEVAKKHGLTLITADKALFDTAVVEGVSSVHYPKP